MGDLFDSDRGPFQAIFGDNASANPVLVMSIVLVIFIILIIAAMRILKKDKGRGEMTDEELEKDRARFDDRMHKQAAFDGKDYVPERARAAEAAEIAEADRVFGRKKDSDN